MGSLDHDSYMAKRKTRVLVDMDDGPAAGATNKRPAAFNPAFATSADLKSQQAAAAQSPRFHQQSAAPMEASGVGNGPALGATLPLQSTQAMVTYRPPGLAPPMQGALAALSGPETR